MVYLISYTLLNPGASFWYVLPLIFILQLMAGVGLAGLVMVIRETPGRFKPLKGLMSLVAALLIISLLYVNLAVITLGPSFSGDPRASTYKLVANWLRENTRPEESVAAMEIGYLGYFTDNQIIDLAGLIDPVIADHTATEGFAWGFWHYQADYYIYAEAFDWAIAEMKPPLDNYRLVYQVEQTASASELFYPHMSIYKRID